MYDNDWSNVYLVANVLLWVTTFIIYQYKKRYFGVGSGILLLYTCISIAAIHLYNSKEYSHMFESLSMFPFIYLFGMILLVSSPILVMKEKNLHRIEPPSLYFFNTVCIVIILFVFIGLPKTISVVHENLALIIWDEGAGREFYGESASEYISKAKSEMNVLSIFCNICCSCSFIFFCYYLTWQDKNKLILIGLCIGALSSPLFSISSGGRLSTASFLVNAVFMLIFIRNILPIRLKWRIIRTFSMLFLLLLIPFFAITLSRSKGDMEKTALSIERYGAEGVLRFNNYGLDAGGIRNGDYTVVAFKKMLGLNPAMYYKGRLEKYAHLKLDESMFYTFVGDFTLDYGPVLAVLIFIITAFFFRKCLRQRGGSITFHQLLMFYLLMTGCLGYFQFPLGREFGNLQMISHLMLALIFKLEYDFRKRKTMRKKNVL